MTLGSPAFERNLRGKLRELFRQSPDLRKQRNKASRLSSRSRSSVMGRLMALVVSVGLLATYSSGDATATLGAAAVSLWAIGSAFKLATACLTSFYGSMDLFVLHHLPLNHGQIFRIQGRRFLKHSQWALVDFAFAYAVLALLHKTTALAVAAGLLIGLFQGALTLALAIHLASRLPHWPLSSIGGFLRTGAFFLLFFGSSLLESIPGLATIIDLSNPSGWVNYAFRQVALNNAWWMLVLLVPVSMIIWSAKVSWKRLQLAYHSLDEMELEIEREQPDLPASLETGDDHTRKKGITEITDGILAGEFRDNINWRGGGWIERVMGYFWNARERMLAGILLGGLPKWSRTYHRTAVILAICSLMLMLLKDSGYIVIFIAGYILVTTTYSIFAREWRGLQSVQAPGGFIPFYAFYPIGYRDIVSILWKTNFVRWLVAGPYYILFGLFAGWVTGSGASAGLEMALEIYFLLFALQPLIVFFIISAGTNDSTKGNFFSVQLLICAFLPIFLTILGLTVYLFLTTGRTAAFVSVAGVFVLSALCLGLQYLGNRRGWFDLVSNPSGKQEK